MKSVIFCPDSELKLIDNNVFESCAIENIIIPSQVEEICEYSFGDCNKLKVIIFPKNSKLKIIQKDAFKNSAIEEIIIPSQVEILNGFSCCHSLKNIIFEDDTHLKKIEEYSFSRSSIESITIPSQVEEICEYSFGDCNKLKEITFPKNSKLKIIQKDAFKNSAIEEIIIPSQVEILNGFSCCHSLKNIIFEDDTHLKKIEEYSFSRSSIESITIPSQVEVIENYAFYFCCNLKTVIFDKNSKLTRLGQSAFEKSHISSIHIPMQVIDIGSSCFFNCKNLRNVFIPNDSKLSKIEYSTFSYSSINKIKIPSSVTIIKEDAFSNCEKLKILQISPDSKLEKIDYFAFGKSFKTIDKVISPLSLVSTVCERIQTCQYFGFDDIPPKQLYLEITDEVVDLDIIANNLKNIMEICLPNAKQVNLTLDCNFPELFVQRDAILTGDGITSQKHRIVYCKKGSFDMYMIDPVEYEKLYQEVNNNMKLGEGATSVVYKIPNKNISKSFFALKIYKCDTNAANNDNNNDNESNWSDDDDDDDNEPEFIIDIDKIRYFLQEYEILNSLNHPNILSAYGFYNGDLQHRPAIILEYCKHKLVKSFNKLSDFDLICIIYEIAKAMEYVHKFNIIHRDLKPDNILLDANKHVKICDFGISAFIDVETQRRTQSQTHEIGTLMYMAPEMYSNMRYNQKVDVYAFGIIFYNILQRGKYPDMTIADVVSGKKINIPSSINEFSGNLIKRSTAYDYHSRPSFSEITQEIYDNDFKLIDNIEIDVERIINHINYYD